MAAREPFSESSEELEAKKQAAERDLTFAYKRVFESLDGKTILADLKKQVRCNDWEYLKVAISQPNPLENVAMLTMAKGLIYHIERHLFTNVQAKEEKREKLRKMQKSPQ
jgi:CRISPR/Cas system-associated exonuclease Cas4 (RecB family)